MKSGYDPAALRIHKAQLEAQIGRFDMAQQEEWAKKQAAIKATSLFQSLKGQNFSVVNTFPDFELTPARASFLDGVNKFLGQRERTNRRLDMIVSAIMTNTYHGGKICIALCGEDYVMESGIKTRILLVNGGTTIGACLNYGLTAKHNVLQYIFCPTVKDVGDLYNTFDRSESTRSAGDQAKSVLVGRADLEKWRDSSDRHPRSKVFANCLTAAMVAKFGPSYRSKQMTMSEKNVVASAGYDKEMLWLMEYVYNESTPSYLKKVVGVLGPMLHSHMVWGDCCKMFWDDLKQGWPEGLPNNSPHRMAFKKRDRSPQAALLTYLQDLEKPGTAREDERTVHGKVMTTINAWAAGKKTFSVPESPVKETGWDRTPIEMAYFHPHPANMPSQDD